jgi:hypothetical protein
MRQFTKKDYESKDGMLTSVWGPGMWHYLHTISFNYPIKPTEKEKNNYKRFIYSLGHTLPCKYCRINYANNLKKHPITSKHLMNRNSFSRYIYNLHNIVNKMLNKPNNLSYNDIKDRYEHFRARCNKTKKRCSTALTGKKTRCILKIVSINNKSKSFQICTKKN